MRAVEMRLHGAQHAQDVRLRRRHGRERHRGGAAAQVELGDLLERLVARLHRVVPHAAVDVQVDEPRREIATPQI
jgi:hypothetical protein